MGQPILRVYARRVHDVVIRTSRRWQICHRTSRTRGTKDRLIATLAYQLTLSIPGTRSYIEDAIERDPGIFHKNILNQVDTLIIKPFQSASSTRPALTNVLGYVKNFTYSIRVLFRYRLRYNTVNMILCIGPQNLLTDSEEDDMYEGRN